MDQARIGVIKFSVEHSYEGPLDDVSCEVAVSNQGGLEVYHSVTTCRSEIHITDAKLWWPRFSHPKPGYLYTFEVQYSMIFARTLK